MPKQLHKSAHLNARRLHLVPAIMHVLCLSLFGVTIQQRIHHLRVGKNRSAHMRQVPEISTVDHAHWSLAIHSQAIPSQ